MAASAVSPGASHTPLALPHTSSRQQRSNPSTRSTAARTPASVGQSHAPSTARTPAERLARDVKDQSPSYFGLSISTSPPDGCDCTQARRHWSPATNNVRSTAVASPRGVPLDQNPDFEASKRQADLNKNGFGNSWTGPRPCGSLSGISIKQSRRSSEASGKECKESEPVARTTTQHAPKESDCNMKLPTSDKQRSPKRLLSSPIVDVTGRPRRKSPASFSSPDEETDSQAILFANDPARRIDRSLPAEPSASQSPTAARRMASFNRADTLPAQFDAEKSSDGSPDGPTFVSPQHVVGVLETSNEDVLLLDLRVSTQFALASIVGALNLCIPTTLLKRPSFNVQKLTETFKDANQRSRFEKWRNSRQIIVFDAVTDQFNDAATCVNTLKKFISEGWKGGSYIIRGGFEEFASKFPHLTTRTKKATSPSKPVLTISTDRPEVAPVVGGCPMPVQKTAANPFFGNIRQNMDLIGGVGQMSVKRPAAMTRRMEDELPQWIKAAADVQDNGKRVAGKFLAIEKNEQKRMQDALSGNVSYNPPPMRSPKTPLSPSGIRRLRDGRHQLAGIEKGNKNRYNNIWPYEHSQVKLQNTSPGACDYFNANFIKSRWSSKRYIATQAPIPATFADFWNIVWQQDVRVIVMLTAEHESGQVKAHNYWKADTYGNLVLTFLSEHRASIEPERIHHHCGHAHSSSQSRSRSSSSRSSPSNAASTAHDSRAPQQGNFFAGAAPGQRRASVMNDAFSDAAAAAAAASTSLPSSAAEERPCVTVRRFTLSRADRPFERMREITQLQYSNWPDFGAPAHPTHLVGLVEQCEALVRQSQRGSHGNEKEKQKMEQRAAVRPVVVHCSAGCGRTGTFCTVDSVVDLLRKQRAHRERKEREADKGKINTNFGESTPMDVDSPVGRRKSKGASIDALGTSIDGVDFFASPAQAVKTIDYAVAASASASSRTGHPDSSFSPPPTGGGKAKGEDAGGDDWLERDDVDLVEKVVEEFRLQRLSMVQSLRQYVLCYESVMEWLVVQWV